MDNAHLIATMSLAFGLGLLHALDADHVMAVSGFASQQPRLKRNLRFCLHWALGHGTTLITLGGFVLLLGFILPNQLSLWAERAVALLLLSLGIWILYSLKDQRYRSCCHAPAMDQSAVHQSTSQQRCHGAVLVGILHGIAGSAPLFAIIPVIKLGSAWAGMLYLFLFCLGVIASMLLFGGVLGGMYKLLLSKGTYAFQAFRALIGLSSFSYGAYLLHSL